MEDLLTLDAIRQELLAWLNNLLQLNVTKVEQCGTGYAHSTPHTSYMVRRADGSTLYRGTWRRLWTCAYEIRYRAALCQIFDSIFRECRPAAIRPGHVALTVLLVDVPMSRVKFNVNTEYAYLQNFKILQSNSLSLPTHLSTHTRHLLTSAPSP